MTPRPTIITSTRSMAAQTRWTVRGYACWLWLLAAAGCAPLVWWGLNEGAARWPPPAWACTLLLLGLIEAALSIYLWQLPDRSALLAAACWTALASAVLAMGFAWLLRLDPASPSAVRWGLAGYLVGGRATATCFALLCLTATWSYSAGKRAAIMAAAE